MVRFVEKKEDIPQIWVKGAENTSKLKCKVCEEWINHWKKLAGCKKNDKVYCCHPDHEKSGDKIAEIGAHVKKRASPKNKKHVELTAEDFSDIVKKKLFIIPVCENHNITETRSILIPKELLMDATPCKPRKIKLVIQHQRQGRKI